MREVKRIQVEKPKPFAFFVLRGRKRFSAKELVVAQVIANLDDFRFGQVEDFYRKVGRIQKEEKRAIC